MNDFTPSEMAIVKKVARDVTINRDQNAEATSESYLWLCENLKTVERYRTEPGGAGKLYKALKNAHYERHLALKKQQKPWLFDVDNQTIDSLIARHIKENTNSTINDRMNARSYSTALKEYFLGLRSSSKIAADYGIPRTTLQKAIRSIRLTAAELYFDSPFWEIRYDDESQYMQGLYNPIELSYEDTFSYL